LLVVTGTNIEMRPQQIFYGCSKKNVTRLSSKPFT
jgi:hypothetical protein